MDNINFIKILFAQMAIFMVVIGALMNTAEKYLPVFIARTFRYGKFAYKGTSKCSFKPIEIPKSWFRHFYIFSSVAISYTMFVLINSYILNNSVPTWITELLNKFGGATRYPTVTPTATFVAMSLLTLQCYRRFYDTQFVSVFGKNSRMNLSHYFVGFAHYAGAIMAILAEAPMFTSASTKNVQIKFTEISYSEILGSMIFLWAWWHQYKATKILANLRKNPEGKMVSNGHFMPKGDLFEYISSPHLFCEILMYLSLTIVLWNNSTWWYVLYWVVSNQSETAYLSHKWYKETFPNYPKERKILIPYVF